MSTKGNNVIAAIVRGELDDDIDAILGAEVSGVPQWRIA